MSKYLNFLGIEEIFNILYDLLNEMLGGLFLWLSKHIYSWIASVYEIFQLMCKGKLLDNQIMSELSNRIGLLLGLVMFLMVIISVVQMLVDPDKLTDKEHGAGKIIFKVLAVIFMFGVSSFVFDAMYHVQNVVLDSHVIDKLLLPYEYNTENFGANLSYNLFSSFYELSEEANELYPDDPNVSLCRNKLNVLEMEIVSTGSYENVLKCSNLEAAGGSVNVIDYDSILMLITGVFVLYFIFTYCISVGIRMIQLAFLEIIAPMAFVSYLSPKKDTMFSKWVKIYISTFIDVFIRIAIINFVAFLITMILMMQK